MTSSHDETLQGDLFGADSYVTSDEQRAGGAEPREDGPVVPFRMEPISVADHELAAINAQENRSGARTFLPVSDARLKALQAKTMVDDRLHAFALHPDESVPLALVGNVNSKKPWNVGKDGPTRSKWLRDVLYQRAMKQAMQDGHLWTALLDRLANKLWPHVHMPENYRFSLEGSPFEEDPVPLQHPGDVARKIVPWIQSVSSPSELEPVWTFRYQPVREALCEHAQCLDAEWIHRILQDPLWGPYLARNRHLTEIQNQTIIDWALGHLGSTGQGGGSAGRDAHLTLTAFEESGKALPETVFRTLLDGIEPWEPPTTQSRYRRVPSVYAGTRRGEAISALLEMDSTRPPHLIELYPKVKHETGRVEAIVKHPGADLSVWRLVVQDTSHFPVRDYLSGLPEAREDPAIRKVLGKSSSNSVLTDLCRDASPEDFSRHFARIVKTNGLDALGLLSQEDFDTRRASLSDIRPLVEEKLNLPLSWRGTRFNSRTRPQLLHMRVLLAIHGKPLRDDTPDEEGRTATVYAEERLRPALRELFNDDPAESVRILEKHGNIVMGLVDPIDLTPLLESDDRRIRMAAMLAIGEITASADVTASQEKQPAGREARIPS